MRNQIWQTWRSGYWMWSATYLVMMENSALLELENDTKNFQDGLITSRLWCTQWQVSWHYTGSSYLIWCLITFSFLVQLYLTQPANYFNSKCIIHSLKPKKSSSCNEITSKILKACASPISHPLSYIYSHSLYTGIFPDCLKIAVLKPLYKNGDKTSMTNYRPVSLITVFSMVLMKAIHSRLSQHLHTTNILVTEQ